MRDEDDIHREVSALQRRVGRLRVMTWLKLATSLVIVVAMVGHIVVVYNTANSLAVESVHVVSVEPESIEGDFTVTFRISLDNPTGGSIDVDRLTYEVHLEDEPIGDGEKSDFQVVPGSQSLDFSATFNAYQLAGPVQEAFFQAKARLTIEGDVTVPVKLFGVWRYTEVTVPYSHEEDVSAGVEPPDNPPPTPVVLAPPVYRLTASAELTWSLNADTDFARYEVHHSTEPDFTASAATLVASITEQTTTTHTVGNLQHLTTHYFRIRVYDEAGQHADSNIASIIIP